LTKPLYFYNGSSFEEIGPTTPQSPIAYQTSAPTGPATGDLWIDSDGDVDTYNRQLTRYYFVATAAQTTISGVDANSLTLAYVAGSEAVYVNGALQVRGQDYTATNGTSVVMSSALAVNDVVEIFAYTAFTVANTYTQAQIDALVGNWISFTPTWTNLTVGNGTQTAKYCKINKVVFFEVRLVFGSTTSITGRVSLDWPVAPASTAAANMASVNLAFEDVSDGPYPGFKFNQQSNTTKFELLPIKADGTYAKYGLLSSTVPFTWTTSDEINLSGFYEVA